MGVFSTITRFVNTHCNKFIGAGAIVLGPLLLTRYIKQQIFNWQQTQIDEFMEKNRKQRHFEITHRTFGDFIVKLIPSINKALHEAIDTQSVIADIQTRPENSAELWDKILKTLVVTKIICLVYLCTLLVVATRIQMNVLSGLLYNNTDILSSEEMKRYLALSKKFLDTRLNSLKELVLKECGKILKDLPLNQTLNIVEVENLFWTIKTAVEESPDNPIENLKEILLVDKTKISASNKHLYNVMMLDTCDLLESEEVRNLTSETVIRSLSLVSDKLAEFFVPPELASSNPSSAKIPLANLISIINGLLSKNDLSGQLVQLLINDDRMKILDANIYEAFSSDYNYNIM